MTLYEVVLRLGGRDEVRLTDHSELELGDPQLLRGERWVIVAEAKPESRWASKRLFVERSEVGLDRDPGPGPTSTDDAGNAGPATPS